MNKIIKNALARHMTPSKDNHKKTIYNDIILQEFIKTKQDIILTNNKIKYLQMKIGIVWQTILGTLPGVQDLGIGDESALDLKFTDKNGQKYIIELKNSYNTDNSSSRARNIEKLGEFINKNKDFIPIYGIINSKHGHDEDKTITFKKTKVRLLSGELFLKFIFQNTKYTQVIKTLSKEIKPYLEHIQS